MPAIQDLLKLLVTVPVSYHHDIKAITDPVNEKVAILIEKTHEEMMSALRDLMIESTVSWDKRSPLLDYFFNHISALKLFIDNIEPLSEEAFAHLGSNLAQLITNMHQILNLSDSEILTVKYAGQDIKLHGLQKGLFGGYGTCRSGLVLKNTLLAKFEFTTNNLEEINKGIIPALWEHQSHLLIKKQAEKIDSLTAEIVTLKHQLFMLGEGSIRKTEDKTSKTSVESPSLFKLFQAFFTEEEYPENPTHVNKGPCGRF